MNACKLCFELESHELVQPWNKPLFESPNFVAVASVGALVEGWLLLVPRHHFISLAALPASLLAEIKEFKEFLCSVLTRCYGAASAFEHGPFAPNRTVGCGVDHAHLHLVPVSFDLASEVSDLFPPGVDWVPSGVEECREAFRQGKDYLYLEQPIGFGRIATHDTFGSQLFRQAIARRIGVPEQYNWREHDQSEKVIATIQRIRAWLSAEYPNRNWPDVAA